MDSKNILISYQHYVNGIEWEWHGESEWIYVGVDAELKREIVTDLINAFFTEEKVYLITDRHTSSLIEKELALDGVLNALQEFNPALASTDFNKIIKFDKIGVLKKGQRKK